MSLRNRVKPVTFRNAAAMRKKPTESEALLRRHLNRQSKYTFKTQSVLAGYIADFYCARVRVVVEVDGSSHDTKSRDDATRDAILFQRFKILTLRFSVAEVMAAPESVVDKIVRFCDSAPAKTRTKKPKDK